MGVGFDTLPDEVIIRIFQELGISDILSCTLTCRLFHTTIQDSVVLQYHLQLAVSGMHDANCQHLTIADRITQLQDVQHGWANLHFRQRYQTQFNPGNVWEMFGGVLAQGLSGPQTRGLAFRKLPSAVSMSFGHSWEHRDLGVDIRDFAMDPAQDLLVLIALPVAAALELVPPVYRFPVHLRTMRDGENHPLASDPVLSFIPNPWYPRNDFVIQIMDDFLAILFHTPKGSWFDELFIWDWKRGQLVTNMKASPSTGKIDSFSFLSPRHFVIPRFGTNLDDSTTHDAAALQVFDFLTHRFGGSMSPQLEHTYELPRLAEGYFLESMLTRSDPSPSSSSQSFASCDRPFYTAPTSRLLVVSMVFHTPWNPATSYILFVHHSTLLKGLATESRLGGVVVSWDRWVPTKTRIIATRRNELSWVCYVHGTRYVRSTPAGSTVMELPSYHLHMLDFNPSAPKRACRHASSGETVSSPSQEDSTLGDGTMVPASQPTIFQPPNSVFATRVHTTLPYWEVFTTR